MVYLPRLQERADYSLQRLREAGFEDIVLVEGVDGVREDARAIGEQRGVFFDPGLAPGEMGCALSMIGLWQKVVDETLPYMLVFEDDVLPHPDIGRLGPQYWAETPRDTDFVFLGSQLIADNLPDPRRRVVVSPSWCLHAYVIAQEGARRALALLEEQISCLDRWIVPIDNEVRRWMETDAIRYSCWNGTMLPAPYPTNGRCDDGDQGPNVVHSTRSTGLFFQNLALGSAIWDRSSRNGARRRRKPKAILITPMTPSRSRNGLRMRGGVALEGLARSCDVTYVLAPVYSDDVAGEWILECAERVHVLTADVADPFLRHIARGAPNEAQRHARLTYPRPLTTAWSTPAAAASIVDLVGGEADLIYVLGHYLAPLAEPWLDSRHRTRFILDVDSFEPPVLRKVAELCRLQDDPGYAEVAEADAGRLEALAREWIPRADLVLTASDVEIASLRPLVGDVRAQVLPNPVPLRGREGWAERSDVLLVADFGYEPNQDAARWLCGEILPCLRVLMGRRVRVTLAGGHVVPSVAELEDEDITVVRHPESVTPLYEAATLAVVPLRAGGGTRLKILEAFGHRRAVVSTSLGAEGLPVAAERHLLIADDAEDFAQACVRALSDYNLRSNLVNAAVEVATAHAWHRIAAMVSGIALSECDVRRQATVNAGV